MVHDGDTVADFEKLIEILTDDKNGGAGTGKVDKRLTNMGCSARIHAPCRLVDNHYGWRAIKLTPDNELLQITAGKG